MLTINIVTSAINRVVSMVLALIIIWKRNQIMLVPIFIKCHLMVKANNIQELAGHTSNYMIIRRVLLTVNTCIQFILCLREIYRVQQMLLLCML